MNEKYFEPTREHGEPMLQIDELPQLAIGIGSIDPDTRMANNELNKQEVEEFARAIKSDEFDAAVADWLIPCVCVDGRCGSCEAGPNAAGGTFSLVAAEALTDANDITTALHEGDTAAKHAERVYGALVDQGHRIGGHTDEHAAHENSGCGAQDKLGDIFAFISQRGAAVRDIAASLGIEVSDGLHERILGNATKRLTDGYVTNGAELLQAFIKSAGPGSVDTVQGGHKEALLRINTKSGTTLDRAHLRTVYGDNVQAFNLDVWGLQNGVKAVSVNEQEAQIKLIGALYYNIATAAVLAGPSLRVVTR